MERAGEISASDLDMPDPWATVVGTETAPPTSSPLSPPRRRVI
jgi:hypothetical protein